MRIRDSSGIYNSIDTSLDHDTSILSYKDIQSAETRLRTIEMISKYRENKIKREFIKLEFDLKSQKERAINEGINPLAMKINSPRND